MARRNKIYLGEGLDPSNYRTSLTGTLSCIFGHIAGTRMATPFNDSSCPARGGTLIAQQRKDGKWDIIARIIKDGEIIFDIRIADLTTEQASTQMSGAGAKNRKDKFGCG